MQSDYYRHDFDAMINFDYQEQAAKAVDCLAQMDTTAANGGEIAGFQRVELPRRMIPACSVKGRQSSRVIIISAGAVQILWR